MPLGSSPNNDTADISYCYCLYQGNLHNAVTSLPYTPSLEIQREHHPDYNADLEQFLPRNISLQRNEASEQLGFNIRGGKEHHCGIYVSKVMPGSEAERLGLHEGDQILSVNGVGFESIEHAEAVKILKKDSKIWMIVRNFPYGYHQTYDKS